MDNFWALIGGVAFALILLGVGLRLWDRMNESA
jgi:hypothetical protein